MATQQPENLCKKYFCVKLAYKEETGEQEAGGCVGYVQSILYFISLGVAICVLISTLIGASLMHDESTPDFTKEASYDGVLRLEYYSVVMQCIFMGLYVLTAVDTWMTRVLNWDKGILDPSFEMAAKKLLTILTLVLAAFNLGQDHSNNLDTIKKDAYYDNYAATFTFAFALFLLDGVYTFTSAGFDSSFVRKIIAKPSITQTITSLTCLTPAMIILWNYTNEKEESITTALFSTFSVIILGILLILKIVFRFILEENQKQGKGWVFGLVAEDLSLHVTSGVALILLATKMGNQFENSSYSPTNATSPSSMEMDQFDGRLWGCTVLIATSLFVSTLAIAKEGEEYAELPIDNNDFQGTFQKQSTSSIIRNNGRVVLKGLFGRIDQVLASESNSVPPFLRFLLAMAPAGIMVMMAIFEQDVYNEAFKRYTAWFLLSLSAFIVTVELLSLFFQEGVLLERFYGLSGALVVSSAFVLGQDKGALPVASMTLAVLWHLWKNGIFVNEERKWKEELPSLILVALSFGMHLWFLIEEDWDHTSSIVSFILKAVHLFVIGIGMISLGMKIQLPSAHKMVLRPLVSVSVLTMDALLLSEKFWSGHHTNILFLALVFYTMYNVFGSGRI